MRLVIVSNRLPFTVSFEEGRPRFPSGNVAFKRSPLRDVATLVRSVHYAALAGLDRHVELGGISPENLPRFESWLRFWNFWVSAACLKAWFETVSASGSGILPHDEEGLRLLLRAYRLASMVNEIGARLKDGLRG